MTPAQWFRAARRALIDLRRAALRRGETEIAREAEQLLAGLKAMGELA